jgi:hypothetical protein
MTVYEIDDSKPFISSGGLPVQWHTGGCAMALLSSRGVRVNSRGLNFKARSWNIRQSLASLGWDIQHCQISPYGLCGTETSTVFPSTDTPVVNERRDWECESPSTLRAVTNASRYDASACDVLDAGRDYLLAGSVLYTRDSSDMPTWMYWTICVLVVYLVRCLSKYILASLSKDKEGKYPDSVVCVIVCLFTTLLLLARGDSGMVTVEDLIFYWFSVFYVFAYLSLFIGTRLVAHLEASVINDPPFYNLLAGVMLTVACQLFGGAETPYNPALIFIIATRVFVKSRRGRMDILRGTTMLLDAFMLGLLSKYGFTSESQYLIAVYAAAWSASDILVTP